MKSGTVVNLVVIAGVVVIGYVVVRKLADVAGGEASALSGDFAAVDQAASTASDLNMAAAGPLNDLNAWVQSPSARLANIPQFLSDTFGGLFSTTPIDGLTDGMASDPRIPSGGGGGGW